MYLASEIYSNIFKYLRPDETMRAALSCRSIFSESIIFTKLIKEESIDESLIKICNQSKKIQTFYSNIYLQPKTKTPVCAITAGHNHIVICSKGSVFVKGSNDEYQLGLMKKGYYSNFTMLKTDKKVRKCSAGLWHTLFLLNTGIVYSCGKNKFNQLARQKESLREPLDGILDMQCKDVSACDNFSIFLKTDGSIIGYGKSKAHCVERRAKNKRSKPVSFSHTPQKLTNINAIAVNKHCVIVRIDDKIFGWGKLSANSKRITRKAHRLI